MRAHYVFTFIRVLLIEHRGERTKAKRNVMLTNGNKKKTHFFDVQPHRYRSRRREILEISFNALMPTNSARLIPAPDN